MGRLLQIIVEKVLFWLLIYMLGYLRWDWLWSVVTLSACYVLQRRLVEQRVVKEDVSEATTPTDNGGIQLRHSDLQKVEWINLIISQVWPYLDGFLKLVLQSVEEDSNLKARLAGYHIRSISFPHGSLGKIPPKLAGIKFHQATHRDEVILDMDLEYAGDLVVLLEATLLNDNMPPVKASLSNLTLSSAKMRVHLRPLLVDVPFVGSITISFLNTPDLGNLTIFFFEMSFIIP